MFLEVVLVSKVLAVVVEKGQISLIGHLTVLSINGSDQSNGALKR